MDQQNEGGLDYIHIHQNEFSYRKHKKQREEDIAICECKFDFSEPDSACGERCLNVLTSTECTPGYCPCGVYCKNQKFQKCEYAQTKLFKTEGRGWGLRAAEDMKAGKFIIEYCGEVISWKEAKRRSQIYEVQGVKDAFIISLNAVESIDATKKGSLARFINHSCQPNCETRKWTVLGEIRVGIFAKQDISAGAELAYDYNFEWYGGAKVRCLCGASTCSGFLGAKSRGFQEDTYVWEDDDERYSVEKIPIYDSDEDEPFSKLLKATVAVESECIMKEKTGNSMVLTVSAGDYLGDSTAALIIEPLNSDQMEGIVLNELKAEVNETGDLCSQDNQQAFSQKNGKSLMKPGNVSKRRSPKYPNGRLRYVSPKHVDAKTVASLLASKESQDEIVKYDEIKNLATSELDSIYNEIRPAIEEYERDSQDSVSPTLAEKWIKASCEKLKAEFNLHSSIIRNVACTPLRSIGKAEPSEGGDHDNEINLTI